MRSNSLPRFQGLLSPLVYRDGGIDLLDQTQLPSRLVVLRITDYLELADAIRKMKVRGAPAIGIAAAYGIVLGMQEGAEKGDLAARFAQVAAELRGTRPTAVNLFWALKRMERVFQANKTRTSQELVGILLNEARRIHAEDIAANQKMGQHGATLFKDETTVLTHCNAGALATGGYGTALGMIRAGWEAGKVVNVFVDETRPLLQGARLTAWELKETGIPFELVTDSMAGHLMAHGEVNAVVVGADRITANGDVANKIGTYTLAVLAKHHEIPFYVVAPSSTVDLSLHDGREIPIEHRPVEEVFNLQGVRVAPAGIKARNPAFDVTPHDLITAIVTERGILMSPFEGGIHAVY